MRILIDVRTISDHFPGIGRYTYNLVRSLAQQLENDELILLSNPALTNTRFDIRAIGPGSKVRAAITATRPFTMREQVHLPGELRGLTPAVTHFPYSVIPFTVPRPKVVTIHDVIPIRMPQYFSLRHRILYRISLTLALRSAEFVICLSNATASDLKAVFRMDPSRAVVVPSGISESFRPFTSTESESVRAKYGLNAPYLLYVGSNKPHKNLPSLIDACARLKASPLLVLAGEEDPRYPEARQRAQKLGITDRVRFLGAVREKDLGALYSGALAFVFPSKYEGFGFPPLEAMACGVPVACSDIPSLGETVGDAALRFNPGNPEAIAAAIERILTDGDLRSDLRERGLRQAAELSWNQAARQTLDIYHRAANR